MIDESDNPVIMKCKLGGLKMIKNYVSGNLLVMILFFVMPLCLFGNGATMGRSGHSILPIENDSIKLVYELLKMHGEGSVNTNCWYLLENITNSTQKLTIGFYVGDTAFYKNMTDTDYWVAVDGKEPPTEIMKIKDSKSTPSGMAYYITWGMTFYPRERKMVSVEQKLMWATGDAEDGDLLGSSSEGFYYALSLASKWSGKPERMNIYYDFGEDGEFSRDDSSWGMTKLLEINPNNYKWVNQHEVAWLFENTDSIRDIFIYVENYGYKPDKEKVLEQLLFVYNGYIYDDNFNEIQEVFTIYKADKKLYTNEDMKGNMRFGFNRPVGEMKKIKYRYEVYKILLEIYPAFLRNMIYAVHGYRFKEEPWKSLFSKCGWYKPKDDFHESTFNDFEIKNIAFIKNYEKEVAVLLKTMP
jgi:hypothetical protein